MPGGSDLAREVADEFPGLAGAIYLNTAAEGLPMRSHARALQSYVALKQLGSRGRDGLYEAEQRARELVARLVHVDTHDIAFLASTARGLDVALKSIDWHAGDNIVLPDSEFPSTEFAAANLARRGVECRIIRSRDGRIDLDDLRGTLDHRTRLVAVSLVSFKTGHKIDLRTWADIVHARDALLFVDAVQALGAVEVEAGAADFLCAATYKWVLGQHGVAVFYVNPSLSGMNPPYVAFRGVKDLFPAERGSYALLPDARRFEEGMPNFPALFVLADACEFLLSVGIGRIEAHNGELAGLVLAGLVEMGLAPLTPRDQDVRGAIVSFEVPGAEEITAALAESGVHVWGRDGRIRISPHLYNSAADIDVALRCMRPLIRARHDA